MKLDNLYLQICFFCYHAGKHTMKTGEVQHNLNIYS